MAQQHQPNEYKQDYSCNTDKIVNNLSADQPDSQAQSISPQTTKYYNQNQKDKGNVNVNNQDEQMCQVTQQFASIEGYLALKRCLDDIIIDNNSKSWHVCRYPSQQRM